MKCNKKKDAGHVDLLIQSSGGNSKKNKGINARIAVYSLLRKIKKLVSLIRKFGLGSGFWKGKLSTIFQEIVSVAFQL